MPPTKGNPVKWVNSFKNNFFMLVICPYIACYGCFEVQTVSCLHFLFIDLYIEKFQIFFM